MTQTVKGPDGRVHNFPDQATPEQIQAAMRKTYGMQAPAKSSAAPQPAQQGHWQAGTERTPFTAPKITGNPTADVALEPVTGYWDRYKAANKFGSDMLAHGLKTTTEGDPTGLVGVAAGGASYLASPVSAALEPVSRPINEYVSPLLERAFGTPPEISTPALTALVPGMGIVRAPAALRAPSLPPGARPVAEPKAARVPTKEELKAEATRQYQAAEDAGVIIGPEHLNKAAHSIRRELTANGFHPKLQPGTAIALDELSSSIANGNITLKGLDIVRQVVKNAADGATRTDAKMIGKIVKHIDRIVENLDDSSVVMGNARQGAEALTKARGLWSRAAKAEVIDEAMARAQRRADGSGSGGNLENTMIQEINRIVNTKSLNRGFSGEELAAMRAVGRDANRANVHTLLRLVGKMSPHSNGLMQAIFGIGTLATWNPLVLAPAVAGAIAKPVSTSMTKGNINRISEMVRRGPPERPRPVPQTPQRPLIPYQR
jgi:hypothetical protein